MAELPVLIIAECGSHAMRRADRDLAGNEGGLSRGHMSDASEAADGVNLLQPGRGIQQDAGCGLADGARQFGGADVAQVGIHEHQLKREVEGTCFRLSVIGCFLPSGAKAPALCVADRHG